MVKDATIHKVGRLAGSAICHMHSISFCYDEELLRKIQLICTELDLICSTQEGTKINNEIWQH